MYVETIMRLVTTVSFSVLLNGDHLEILFLREGFAKGIPPLPIIFVGSRGPFMPLKNENSVIDSQGHQGGSIGSDGQSSTLRG
jgi:hypothetical protein